MESGAVPERLRERLGPEATTNLLEMFDQAHREQRSELITACTERFERRLVEEVAGVRVQLAQVETAVRQDTAEMGASIRVEMAEMGASIRQDMAAIRLDMVEMGAGIRAEMAAGRVELLKWCFLFWIGQVVAVGTLMGVMVRLVR